MTQRYGCAARWPVVLCALHTGLVAACAPGLPPAGGSETAQRLDTSEPLAAETVCWDKSTVPALIETETETRLVAPAATLPDGTVVEPAIYETETRATILRDRQEQAFEVPCADVMTPDFIASLQRALAARGAYAGPITGEMDAPTRDAVAAFQTGAAPQDRDTGNTTLTLSTARRLGLVAIDLPDAPDRVAP